MRTASPATAGQRKSPKAKIVVWALLAAVVAAAVIAFLVARGSSTAAAPEDVGQVVRENSRVLSKAPNEQAVLVEFLDYECESCRAAYPFIEDLRAEFEERWGRVEEKKEHGEAWARAAVVREGSDVTLVSYGPSVPTCLAAARAAEEEGLSVEVVDLRTVNPLDEDTMAASVSKTGRAVVVAEPQGFASVASELVARIQKECFHSLAAPVLRVTGWDIPYPAPKLEEHHLPNVDRILDAIDDLNWDLDSEEADA